MKILVVTGSPRKGGNSDIFADAFIEGALSAGNEVHRIDAGRAQIAGCKACEYCMTHEGDCIQKDDMQDFYDDLCWAELTVYAFPMYFYTYPAQIKAFMDRQFCAIGGKPINFNKVALLLAFEDKDPSTADGLIRCFEIAMNYCHAEIVKIIIQNGVYEKGAIVGKPGLDEARAFGASLS
ncbi:MAG: flavodoxin family protein [Eggerthellaceae bacterium]|nr:flavodoxin family protein [Eggerthellaceae bacterium]